MAYHVIENTPGYLPETEPTCFRRKRDALAYAAGLARELRELGYRVSGNQREGYYAEDPYGGLGRVVWVYDMGDCGCPDSI